MFVFGFLCVHFLTTFDGRSENVVIEPVVIIELAFRDVGREIFAAHLVIAADDAALKNKPESLQSYCVNGIDNVALGGVVNACMRVVGQTAVDATFISRQQTHLVGHAFTHEGFGIYLVHRLQNTSDYAALTADRANDWHLRFGNMVVPVTALALTAFLPMNVSSASTMPPSLVCGSTSAARILWHMPHAVL